MSELDRPDPEDLLKAIQASEGKSQKGQLKIFLGMAAGVGKTYAMLTAAQKLMQAGVEVVAGVVDTHGRPETAKLLEGLKSIPELEISYKNSTFKELNIDEVLKRNPKIVLVDELAHRNVPGSRHPMRWQDVMELLEAGIGVYATVNIQHLESYKDVVEGIVGVKIQESIPDLVLERATDIELVDITPTELLQRLREGKVYTGDLGEIAAQHFFQEDHLTALRELALRFTAEVVDQELHEMISAIQRGKGWKPRERLLVAIDHRPYSEQLIRTTRRLAFTLHSPWIAVYVDSGVSLNDEERARLAKHLALARDLGAEVITTKDESVAQAIQRVAEQKNVTQIILGKSRKNFFQALLKRSTIVDKLMKKSSDIDIHIIRQPSFSPYKQKKMRGESFTQGLFSYVHILFWTVVLSLFNAWILPHVGYKVVGFVFLLGILLLSLFFKRGPIFLSAVLFALIWTYFFIPPIGSFLVSSSEDAGFIILFILAAFITGILTNQSKKRHALLLKREQAIEAVYDIVREIAAAPSSKQIFNAVQVKLGSFLGGRCEIIAKKWDGSFTFEEGLSLVTSDKEKAVANWVFEHGKEAGWSTSTLPSVKNLYIPLKGFKDVVGILVFRPTSDRMLLPEETNLLYTVAQQVAYYLERTLSEERERKNRYLQQIEKIYEKVLRSISLELNRPLTSIQEAISAFKQEKSFMENERLFSSLYEFESSSTSLTRIAENASTMAKLSAGLIEFRRSPQNINIVIQECGKRVDAALKHHQLKLSVQEELPPIPCDIALIEILLNNLLSNAIEYSPEKTTIEIEAEVVGDAFVLSVLDEGKGIPEDMMELVFEKFYRIPGTSSIGIGLGLAIVKSIAEIHHGWIKAQNRPSGGAKFSLILPLE